MRGLAVLALAALPLGCAAGGIQPVTYGVMPTALTPVDADHNRARDFGRTFCSTLPHFKDPDGHSWGDCAKYLESPGAPQPLQAIPATYRYLFVPGFGSECLKGVRAFSGAIAHVKEAHHVDIEYFAVPPFGSSEENGKAIARQVDAQWTADQTRPYVLIGYSKGAVDILDALRVLDAPKTKVAAVVTIAGAVGGSWLVDDIRKLMNAQQPWIAPGCPGNVEDGLHSLLREVRQSFLRQNPTPVPGYSIVAASTRDETSTLLKPTWNALSVYAKEEDGQMIAWEAVLPAAKYLGTARADHWAIALPFDESPNPPKAIDRNRFPRDALLEAIVRYVAGDLPAP